MQAVDVMTKEVATVRPDSTIVEAIAKMVEGRVSGLPVVDAEGKLVGVLTEGDLLRRVEIGTEAHRSAFRRFMRGPEREAADYVRTRAALVEDVMTIDPATIDPTTSLDEIVATMERRKVRRLPVVAGGKLQGVVSRADLVRALGRAIGSQPATPHADAEIRANILAELGKQDWFAMCTVDVTVEQGRVRLEGFVRSPTVRTALRVVAAQVPGVIAVENQTEVLDPVVNAIGV